MLYRNRIYLIHIFGFSFVKLLNFSSSIYLVRAVSTILKLDIKEMGEVEVGGGLGNSGRYVGGERW